MLVTLPGFPQDLARSQIEEIIGKIGRDVEFFHIYSTFACPDCNLDPITDTSTDSFCQTCSGVYWIPSYSGVTMSAHVTWKYDYQNEFTVGGRTLIGDAQVKVMHSSEREQLIKLTEYLVVDGKTMDLEKTTILGTPPNRIICDLKERSEP
jgi:hypothetical protein